MAVVGGVVGADHGVLLQDLRRVVPAQPTAAAAEAAARGAVDELRGGPGASRRQGGPDRQPHQPGNADAACLRRHRLVGRQVPAAAAQHVPLPLPGLTFAFHSCPKCSKLELRLVDRIDNRVMSMFLPNFTAPFHFRCSANAIRSSRRTTSAPSALSSSCASSTRRSVNFFSPFLLGFTGFYWVLLGFTGFHGLCSDHRSFW